MEIGGVRLIGLRELDLKVFILTKIQDCKRQTVCRYTRTCKCMECVSGVKGTSTPDDGLIT